VRLFLAFGGHIECRATPKVVGDGILGGKAKVGKLHGSITGDQDILWLEVAMVDPYFMAILDGLTHFHESALDECVVVLV
jgi:hypothetical protein